MQRFQFTIIFLFSMSMFFISCDEDSELVTTDEDTEDEETGTVIDVDSDLFVLAGIDEDDITIIDCTLSDGTETTCYQIVTNGLPTDIDLGPWCPENISDVDTDDEEVGGIWIEDDQVWDVDGEFIANLAEFYGDDEWQMYDDETGDIFRALTQTECEDIANPDVGEEYKNYCAQCLPEHISDDLTLTWVIPITPVKQTSSTTFAGGGRPGEVTGPSIRGIAFNGTEFSGSAPVADILGAYTIAPFDDNGGHINVNQGYHYHTHLGTSTEVVQDDDHTAMIGYAYDGYGIYAYDADVLDDLDACNGHTDDVRGYHYHIDQPGANNFIDCLYGAYAI